MSFDLFVIAPSVDRETAERFNRFAHPDLPERLNIALEQCSDGSDFWLMTNDGEEWLELFIDRAATQDSPHRPSGIAADWIEIHVPSHGHPQVFQAVAALADVAQGWVFDPQGAAADVSLETAEDQAAHVARGYYTPAVARDIGNRLAAQYDWD